MEKLNKVLTSRFLKFLDEQSEKDAGDLREILRANINGSSRKALSPISRTRKRSANCCASNRPRSDTGKLTSLADYVKRMPSDQKEIYCLLAANRAAAEASPYFEVFKERKWEVLFLYDPWDEFVIEHLHTFDGKAAAPR